MDESKFHGDKHLSMGGQMKDEEMVGKCSRHEVYEKCVVQEAEASMRRACLNGPQGKCVWRCGLVSSGSGYGTMTSSSERGSFGAGC